MKRHIVVASAIVLGFCSEGVSAACSAPGANQIMGADLFNLLTGKTVCAVRGGDRWQEEHRTDGTLWDYKKGATDPVDPTKKVGTWAITGRGANTIVTYNYGTGGTYAYSVWNNGGGSYSFCKAGVLEMDFTQVNGTGLGCP